MKSTILRLKLKQNGKQITFNTKQARSIPYVSGDPELAQLVAKVKYMEMLENKVTIRLDLI